jgi:hypothetical protein
MHIIPMNKDVEQCVQHCEECHHVCVELLTYCVEKGNKHTEPEHIRILRDCAEICQTAANFMLRGSKLHSLVCNVCAEICRRCAESCEKFGDDDKMRMCAEMCRKCADSCHKMGQMAGAR